MLASLKPSEYVRISSTELRLQTRLDFQQPDFPLEPESPAEVLKALKDHLGITRDNLGV